MNTSRNENSDNNNSRDGRRRGRRINRIIVRNRIDGSNELALAIKMRLETSFVVEVAIGTRPGIMIVIGTYTWRETAI